MEHNELKLGVELALNKLLEIIERGEFKHLKKFYADGTIPENNLKYLIKDAKSLRKSELARLCKSVKSDGSVKGRAIHINHFAVYSFDRENIDLGKLFCLNHGK